MDTHEFVLRTPSIGDYINGVNRGQYDIDPEHQREDGIKSDKWNVEVIRHIYQFRTLTPLYFHTRSSDRVLENLDGKQRTHAINEYMKGNISIPLSSGLPPELCGRYTNLSISNQRLFYNIPVYLLITNDELSDGEVRVFFNDVQKSSSTTPGERMNSDTNNSLNRMIKDEIEANEIIRKICTINDLRMDKRYTIALCVYLYCNGNISKRMPSSDAVIKHGKTFTDEETFREVIDICECVTQWLAVCKIPQNRHDFMAFFILFWSYDEEVVKTVMCNIKSLPNPSKPFKGYVHRSSGAGTNERCAFLIETYTKNMSV